MGAGRMVLMLLFSKPSLAGRGVLCIVAVLLITGVIHMPVIDAEFFGIQDAYLIPMMVFAIVAGALAAIFVRRYTHDKAADNAGIENPYDLEYDKRYDVTTLIVYIFAAALAVVCSPAVTAALVANAEMLSHALIAAGLAIVFTVVGTLMLHFGVRKFIIKTKDYFLGLVDDVTSAADEIADKLDDGEVNGSTTAGKALKRTVKKE